MIVYYSSDTEGYYYCYCCLSDFDVDGDYLLSNLFFMLNY